MQGRSRMAALTLVAGAVLLGTGPTSRADGPAVVNKVTLRLQITGLGRDGCEVEIKPGHPACDFKAIARKVGPTGHTFTDLEVKSTSADRDCLFAITVKEPGQPPRTIRRGLRLDAPAEGKAVPRQFLDCLLRSPSLAAKDSPEKAIR